MSVFGNFFGGGNTSGGGIAHGAGGAVAVPPTQLTPATGAGTQQQQTTATQQQQTTEQAKPSSPLDGFTNIWDTIKDAQGNPVAPTADPTGTPLFNFDTAKVTESARKLNFAQGIDPQLVTKALGGDVDAFTASINHAIQNAFSAMTMQTGQMINQGVTTNNDRFRETLPTQIKRVQLDQTTPVNPILQHEAAQPLVTALKQMAFSKNPNADPVEVSKQVEAYLVGLSQAVNAETPEGKAKIAAAQPPGQNWGAFLEGK